VPDRAKLDGTISAGRFVTILRIRANIQCHAILAYAAGLGAPLIVLKSCDFKGNEYGYSNRLIEQVIEVGQSTSS